MALGGNNKQKACFGSALVLMSVSAVFGFQYLVSGYAGDKAISILTMVLGAISAIGIWTMGFNRRPTEPEEG